MAGASLGISLVCVVSLALGCRSRAPRARGALASSGASATRATSDAGAGGTDLGSAGPDGAGARASAGAQAGADARGLTGPPRFTQTGWTRHAEAGEVLKGSAKSIVCDERTPCRVIETKEAGKDEKGNALEVLGISLRAASVEPGERFAGTCEEIEYWLITRSRKGVIATERLREMCNDGYGAAGVGEDIVEVAPNRFTHTRAGGSAWRWDESETLQLSPRRIVALSHNGHWTLGPNRSGQSWNWEMFHGYQTNFTPECDKDGRPPETWKGDLDASWVVIPMVDTEGDFATTGWRTASLGACAGKVGTDEYAPSDGGAYGGFVVHGVHEGTKDSTLKVVGLTDGSFVVEITDDKLVLGAKRKIYEDHLEIWSGEAPDANYSDHCEEQRTEKPVQWGVRLADGAVFPGYGSPAVDRVSVELASRADGARLKVRLQTEETLVTFVYSDGDSGTAQDAMIATSTLVPGRIRSLGRTTRIDPKNATCAVKNGRLQPVLK